MLQTKAAALQEMQAWLQVKEDELREKQNLLQEEQYAVAQSKLLLDAQLHAAASSMNASAFLVFNDYYQTFLANYVGALHYDATSPGHVSFESADISKSVAELDKLLDTQHIPESQDIESDDASSASDSTDLPDPCFTDDDEDTNGEMDRQIYQ